jgi:hypothetical protein
VQLAETPPKILVLLDAERLVAEEDDRRSMSASCTSWNW